MVLIYQITIFMFIYMASFLGYSIMGIVTVGCILFTLINVWVDWLMMLQLITISVAVMMGIKRINKNGYVKNSIFKRIAIGYIEDSGMGITGYIRMGVSSVVLLIAGILCLTGVGTLPGIVIILGIIRYGFFTKEGVFVGIIPFIVTTVTTIFLIIEGFIMLLNSL